jgi:hypothetical protein
MAESLGIDILGVQDVDAFLSFGSRRQSAAESIMRVLFHEPGAMWWAPDRGYHLARHLHAFFNRDELETNVKAALEADERVESVEVLAEQFGNETRLQIDLILTNEPTAVTFTVQVTEAGELLLDNTPV